MGEKVNWDPGEMEGVSLISSYLGCWDQKSSQSNIYISRTLCVCECVHDKEELFIDFLISKMFIIRWGKSLLLWYASGHWPFNIFSLYGLSDVCHGRECHTETPWSWHFISVSIYKHHENMNLRKTQANLPHPISLSRVQSPSWWFTEKKRSKTWSIRDQGPCRFTRQVAAQSLHCHLDRRVVNFCQLFNHRHHHHTPCREEKSMLAGYKGGWRG